MSFKMKSFAVFSVACFAMASQTLAADLVKTPVTSKGFDWTGGYVGLYSGFASLNANLDGSTESLTGGRLGGFVGANTSLTNGILGGVEVNIDNDWNKKTFTYSSTTYQGSSTVGGAVRGRLGMSFDNLLLFGAAGWTGTNAKLSTSTESAKKNLSGYTLGVGMDYAVTDITFLRAEYRYNGFSKTSFDTSTASYDVKAKQNVFNLGIAMKF